MAYPKPKHSKTTINRAGQTLLMYVVDPGKEWGREELRAMAILSNFRSCHGYPINTFQATLRNKLATIDKSALVMQRLKRLPSIVKKLNRFTGMQLARMQDIGGLRAVTASLKKAYSLKDNYHRSQFKHTLHLHRDYINNPKASGYRSIHLVYKYKNPSVPEYDGLFIELPPPNRRDSLVVDCVHSAEPGSPWENGHVESFNSKLRDELLNGEIFTTLAEAKIIIEQWRREYNEVRPHSALGYRPPIPEAKLSLTLT